MMFFTGVDSLYLHWFRHSHLVWGGLCFFIFSTIVFFVLSCSKYYHVCPFSISSSSSCFHLFAYFLANTRLFEKFSSQIRQQHSTNQSAFCWLPCEVLPSSGETHQLHHFTTIQSRPCLCSSHHSFVLPWLLCRSKCQFYIIHEFILIHGLIQEITERILVVVGLWWVCIHIYQAGKQSSGREGFRGQQRAEDWGIWDHNKS